MRLAGELDAFVQTCCPSLLSGGLWIASDTDRVLTNTYGESLLVFDTGLPEVVVVDVAGAFVTEYTLDAENRHIEAAAELTSAIQATAASNAALLRGSVLGCSAGVRLMWPDSGSSAMSWSSSVLWRLPGLRVIDSTPFGCDQPLPSFLR